MKNSLPFYLSWIGLLGIILATSTTLFNQNELSLWSSFLLFLAVLPIKGFYQNKRYTFQWTGFLSMFFLCVGVSNFFEVATAQSSSFLLLSSSIVLYFGVVFHARKLAHFEASN